MTSETQHASMNGWQPMETAPKDRPIWVAHDRAAAVIWESGTRMTTFGAHNEGLSTLPGKRQCEAVWGGEYSEDDREGGNSFTIPDWWFLNDETFETPLWPVAWRELPEWPA